MKRLARERVSVRQLPDGRWRASSSLGACGCYSIGATAPEAVVNAQHHALSFMAECLLETLREVNRMYLARSKESFLRYLQAEIEKLSGRKVA